MLKNLTFIPQLMGRQVSRLLESQRGVNEWRWESEWVTVNRERWGESESVDDWVRKCKGQSVHCGARIKKKNTVCNSINKPHQHVAVHTVCTLRKSRLCCNVLLHFFPPLLTQQATLMFSVRENVQYEAVALETREPCRYDADLPTLSPDIFRIARQSSISLFLPGNRISQTLLWIIVTHRSII